jgi:hypothetical protein
MRATFPAGARGNSAISHQAFFAGFGFNVLAYS